MARRVKCPKCSQLVEVPAGPGPHVLRCMGCGSSLRVGAPRPAGHGADSSSGSSVMAAMTKSGPAILACDVCGETFPADQVVRRHGEVICRGCLEKRELAGNNETIAGSAETVADRSVGEDAYGGLGVDGGSEAGFEDQPPADDRPTDGGGGVEEPLSDTTAFKQLCSICSQEFDPRDMVQHEGDNICTQCAESMGVLATRQETKKKAKKQAPIQRPVEEDVPRRKRRRKGIPVPAIVGGTSGVLLLITQVALFIIPGPDQFSYKSPVVATQPTKPGPLSAADLPVQIKALIKQSQDLRAANEPAKAAEKEQEALELAKGRDAQLKDPNLRDLLTTLKTKLATQRTETLASAQSPAKEPATAAPITVVKPDQPAASAGKNPLAQSAATSRPGPTVAMNVPPTLPEAPSEAPAPPGQTRLFEENAPPTPAPTAMPAPPTAFVPAPPIPPTPVHPAIVGPTTTPIPGVQLVEPADPLAAFLQRGLNALAAEQWEAAIEAFSDARTLTIKNGRHIDPTTTFIDSGLGAAYFGAGRLDKAAGPLNRALEGPFNRAAFVNRRAIDLATKMNVNRTIQQLRDNLANQKGTPDETMLNLLGTALNQAQPDIKPDRAGTFEAMQRFYAMTDAKLESTRPGEKRWGVTWVPEQRYNELTTARDQAIKRANELAVQVELAQSAYNSVKGRANDGTDTGKMLAQQAQTDLSQKRDALAQAQAAIPTKPWLDKFVPELPDMPATPQNPNAAEGERAAAGPASFPAGSRLIVREAAGFPVGPELVVTAAAALKDATDIGVRPTNGQTVRATLVRKDDGSGLALLRVAGAKFGRFSVAPSFAGGEVTCDGYPDVLPGTVAQAISGKAMPPRAKWVVNLARNPRLPGAPVFDRNSDIVGVVIAERDADPAVLPAVDVGQLVSFLGADRNAGGDRTNDITNVVQVIATYQK